MTPRRFLAAALLASLILTFAAGSAAAQANIPSDLAGRDMVLIHGLGSSAAVWDQMLPILMRGYRVWTYEMPGHGTTPPIKSPTIEKVADHLAAYIAKNGIHDPVLVGHAMGGMVAMCYAFEHPSEVDRLIVIDAAPKQLADDAMKQQIAVELASDYDEFLARYYGSLSRDKMIRDEIVDQALRTDQLTLTQLLLSSYDFDLTPELKRQAVPILVIGSESFFPDPAHAKETLDKMGYADARTISFKTMPGVGHFVMLEQPEYLASVIAAYALHK